MTNSEQKMYREKAAGMFDNCGIVLTKEEKENIELADFGLENFEEEGLMLITYVNTERVCAKELVLLPGQTCCEHRHPPIGAGNIGKEETFRCRFGEVFLYVSGEPAANPSCTAPAANAEFYTVWHEIHLLPGQQYTLFPDTLHWFKAGPLGAVVSEFSTKSLDESDIFTNPNIIR